MTVCGEPTIADEIFVQLSGEPHPIPAWIVTSAGTGTTSAAVGRHLRHYGHPTRLAVVDPANSAYFPAWASGCDDYTTGMPSRIPGIGRPRVEPGFLPAVVDLMIPVPDAASTAALWWLRAVAGVKAGPATGTNFWGTCHLAARMSEAGVRGSIVSVIGDTADPYLNTHLAPSWVCARGWTPHRTRPTSSVLSAPGIGQPGSVLRDARARILPLTTRSVWTGPTSSAAEVEFTFGWTQQTGESRGWKYGLHGSGSRDSWLSGPTPRSPKQPGTPEFASPLCWTRSTVSKKTSGSALRADKTRQSHEADPASGNASPQPTG